MHWWTWEYLGIEGALKVGKLVKIAGEVWMMYNGRSVKWVPPKPPSFFNSGFSFESNDDSVCLFTARLSRYFPIVSKYWYVFSSEEIELLDATRYKLMVSKGALWLNFSTNCEVNTPFRFFEIGCCFMSKMQKFVEITGKVWEWCNGGKNKMALVMTPLFFNNAASAERRRPRKMSMEMSWFLSYQCGEWMLSLVVSVWDFFLWFYFLGFTFSLLLYYPSWIILFRGATVFTHFPFEIQRGVRFEMQGVSLGFLKDHSTYDGSIMMKWCSSDTKFSLEI